MPAAYALDLSGVNPANKVIHELHSANEAQFRDYFFIVPQLAPFYVDNFELSSVNGSTVTILTEDVDFSFALPYVTGTRHTGKQMYGAITLHNLSLNGILRVTYQTIGGDQVADRLMVLSMLADKAYNPRTTIWDVITNTPTAFPPVPHYQDYDDFKGQEAVVAKLADIRDAIIANSSLTSARIDEFLTEFNRGESSVYVKRTGDFISGPLELRQPATSDLHAVNKKYVDESIGNNSWVTMALGNYATTQAMQTALNLKVSKAGDTMGGQLKLSLDPVAPEDSVRKSHLDRVINEQALLIQSLRQDLTQIQLGGVSLQQFTDFKHDLLARLNLMDLRIY